MCNPKHRKKTELLNKTCYNCMHDCKRPASDIRMTCINFTKGFSSKEYWEMIKEDNINIKKLCNKNNLSLNTMYSMLNMKTHWTYKYRVILNSALFEKHEYDKYVEIFDANNFAFIDAERVNYGEK